VTTQRKDPVPAALPDDEAGMFRDAVRGARPLRVAERVVAPRKPAARARFSARERVAVLQESLALSPADLDVSSGDELSFRRGVIQDSVMRKLRRGLYRVEDELDLHGLRLEEARAALREFLSSALARQLRCIRIVHGKGRGSGPRGPVLKGAVNAGLRKVGAVLAFCSARQVDGGTGAIYVLLSAARSRAGARGRAASCVRIPRHRRVEQFAHDRGRE
jgi:DNA-nicking Smr family endonuclease